MHAKKVLSDSEEKKQAINLRMLVDFKRKKTRMSSSFPQLP
jgi:hypothetical protein